MGMYAPEQRRLLDTQRIVVAVGAAATILSGCDGSYRSSTPLYAPPSGR